MPCPNPINCPGIDRPVINLTAELPDEIKFFGYGFFTNGVSRYCEAQTQEAANICAAVPEPDIPGPNTNPPPPTIYLSNSVSCIVDCGGTIERYTTVAGTSVGLSQEEADAAAMAFACQVAALQCDGPVSTFVNVAQTCSVTCANGQSVSFTTPAGIVSGVSQLAADADAYIFACDVAALLCVDLPPLPPGGPGGGAGQPPPQTVTPLWSNGPQTCQVACPGGGTTSFTAQAGLFQATSLAAANAIAASYACVRANQIQACIGDIETTACEGDAYTEPLVASGIVEPIVWSVIAGALPAGLALADDFITGVPTSGGSSTFTLQVTGISSATNDPVSVVRSFTIKVIEITTATALPDGDANDPYEVALAATGYTGTPTWSVVSGALPDGLALHPVTGVLSGTPTESGDFAFVIGLEDSDNHFCTKAFTLTIEAIALSPSNWFKLEEASGNRTDSIRGAILQEFGVTPVNDAPGVIGNGSLHGPPTLFDSAALSSAAQDPLLSCDGTGLDFCGWFKMDIQHATDSCAAQYFSFGTNQFFLIMETVRSLGYVEMNIGGNSTGLEAIQFPIAINNLEWYFFRLYFDPVTGLGGIQIASENDAALPAAVEGAIVHTIAAEADARVSIRAAIAVLPNFFTTFDEVGVFQKKLTDAEANAVFNGGAGRTFP